MNELELLTEQKSNDPLYMKKYLKVALDIESNVLVWEDALNIHKKQLKDVNSELEEFQNAAAYGKKFEQTKESRKAKIQERIQGAKDRIKEEEKKAARKRAIKFIILATIFILFTALCYSKGFEMPIEQSITNDPFFSKLIGAAIFPGMLTMVLSIFVFIIPMAFGNSDIGEFEDYIKKLNEQLKEIDAEEQTVLGNDQYIEANLPQILKKQNYLNDIIPRLNYNLIEAKKLRAIVYEEGVLPDDYQDIVCVASLYQYLKNGICTKIKGDGGIYSTFAYHLKLNEINNNLTKIRQDLQQIKAYQTLLYDKLCDVHDTLSSINSGISNISNEITSNSAIAAESAKRVAIAEEWRNRETWYRS